MAGLSHKDDLLETPPWLIKKIESETGLTLNFDACATKENKKCDDYYCEQDDVLRNTLLIYDGKGHPKIIFCNPPRSVNGKFVNKISEEWKKHNLDIVMLLTWNDLGNKYGEKLFPHILARRIKVKNLGKIKFYKNGKETKFPSRLTYLYAWFKSKH